MRQWDGQQISRQPVSLLLLDINMPILTGLDVVAHVKEKFEQINQRNPLLHDEEEKQINTFTAERSSNKAKILRPFICYLSQLEFKVMRTFIKEEEKADYYLEKPLLAKELIALLRLLSIL